MKADKPCKVISAFRTFDALTSGVLFIFTFHSANLPFKNSNFSTSWLSPDAGKVCHQRRHSLLHIRYTNSDNDTICARSECSVKLYDAFCCLHSRSYCLAFSSSANHSAAARYINIPMLSICSSVKSII